MSGGRGNATLIILWKAYTNEWRIRGEAEGEGNIYRQPENSDQEKRGGRKGERKGRKGLMHFLLRTCHISGTREGGGEEGGGQAGQREERQAFFFFFSRQQNFLQPPTATSQALFFRFGFRRSWRVAWSASFRCRLWQEEDEEKVRIAIITASLLQCVNETVTTNTVRNLPIDDWYILYSVLTFCPDTENKMTSSSSMPQTKPLKVTCKLPEPYEKQAQQISDRQITLKSKVLKEIHTK